MKNLICQEAEGVLGGGSWLQFSVLQRGIWGGEKNQWIFAGGIGMNED